MLKATRRRTLRMLMLAPALLITRAGYGRSRRRVIWGVVTDGRGRPVPGAAVKLKNLITLNVRSFITGDDGQYRFPRVYSEMDYALRARFGDHWSKSKTVTRFEMRDSVRVDLRIKNANVEAVH
jgi:carboxypeptidase family protein